MNKFSDYIKKSTNTDDKNCTSDFKDNNKNNSIKEEDVKNLYDKYSGLGQDQLMHEFVKETAKQKSKGLLNETQINNIKNILSGYLNETEKQKLEDIINMVKDE